MNLRFRSSGKLLLSGEYAILDGAMGLAVPTRKGQSLTVINSGHPGVRWNSKGHDGETWFSTEFTWPEINDYRPFKNSDSVRSKLLHLLQAAKKLNTNFLSESEGYSVETVLEFPRGWGLGTSSTLINNLARWADTDAFELQRVTFGGSGYDIACASRTAPILYQKIGGVPKVKEVPFYPSFASSLFFVYLNRKQDSSSAVSSYRKHANHPHRFTEKVTEITQQMAASEDLGTFEMCINAHERLLSSILDRPTVKEAQFPDYNGAVKSLGAWGGDFIMVTATPKDLPYFERKGFTTIVPYHDMVL